MWREPDAFATTANGSCMAYNVVTATKRIKERISGERHAFFFKAKTRIIVNEDVRRHGICLMLVVLLMMLFLVFLQKSENVWCAARAG